MHIDTDKALNWLAKVRDGVENSNHAAECIVSRAMAATEMAELLEELREWFDERAEAEYHPGNPTGYPNDEMRFSQEITLIFARIKGRR